MIPPILEQAAMSAASDAGATASIDEQEDRYIVTFSRDGASASMTVHTQLFTDSIEWGERRMRAELEHEAARCCRTLTQKETP